MASKAAADSGEGRCVAASTTDQRVLGNTRGAALEEIRPLMLVDSISRCITRNERVVTKTRDRPAEEFSEI